MLRNRARMSALREPSCAILKTFPFQFVKIKASHKDADKRCVMRQVKYLTGLGTMAIALLTFACVPPKNGNSNVNSNVNANSNANSATTNNNVNDSQNES